MRIEFGRIEIHNFMSFADEVFDFSSHDGMSLICGKNNDIPGAKNGCGKSVLFSALVFSLFGETQNKIKNDNIHNRFVASKEVRVVTDIKSDGMTYKIASGFNKYGAAYCTLTSFEDGKEIDLTKSSISETRQFILAEILHCDMSIFLRTIMLSSDLTYNFFRLRKGEKKEFIEKLFDISVFGEMYNHIRYDSNLLDKQIVSQQSKLMQLNKSKDEYTELADSQTRQQQLKLEDMTKTVNDLKILRSELEQHKIYTDDAAIKSCEDLIDKVDDASRKLTDIKTNISSKMSDVDVKMHKLAFTRDTKLKTVDKYAKLLSELCDKCANKFRDYYNISTYGDDISELNKQLKELEDMKCTLKLKLSVADSRQAALDKKHQDLENKIETLTSESTALSRKLIELDSRIKSLDESIDTTRSLDNPYIRLLDNSVTLIAAETLLLDTLSKQYRHLKLAEQIVSQDTLRKFIIKDLIGLLNNKIKTYLTKLGAKYSVLFDADMNYEFLTEGGKCEYDNFSAGERQRIMIATCFAFRDFMAIRNNLSSNILILDEFVDGNVDLVAIEGVMSILKDFVKLYRLNVYVVSHRKEIDNSQFDSIILILKTDNISKVVILDA